MSLISTPQDKLRLSLINARSLRNKTDFTIDFLDSNSINLLAITETWLSPNDQAITSDLFYHSPRDDPCKGGGGVGILAMKQLKITQHNNNKPYSSGDFLHCCISTNSNTHLDIMVIYRYPSFTIDQFLIDFSDFASNIHTKNTILVGDFNIHVNKISNHQTIWFKLYSFP